MKKQSGNNQRVVYRNAQLADVENLVKLELEVWGRQMAADYDKWVSRLTIFPAGTFVAEKQGKIVGVVVTHIIKWDYPPGYYPTWAEATADGYITNHNETGDTAYGVNMTVRPGQPQVAQKLVQLGKSVRRQRNLAQGYIGCRIPSLAKQAKKLNILDFDCETVVRLASQDPEVRFFASNKFKIVTARKNYFPLDKHSLGWAVILADI